jgi:hypothetical protein
MFIMMWIRSSVGRSPHLLLFLAFVILSLSFSFSAIKFFLFQEKSSNFAAQTVDSGVLLCCRCGRDIVGLGHGGGMRGMG